MDLRHIADLSASFTQYSDNVVYDEPTEYKNPFDIDALDKYRDLVQAQNLNTTYEVPTELDEDELTFVEESAISQAKSRCLKQECLSGAQRLKKLRLDQDRRDKLLALKLKSVDRKRKWKEFDIDVNSALKYTKVCQELEALNKVKFVTQLSENEQEYRRSMRLPYFVDLFFDIEVKLFPDLGEDAENVVRRVWSTTGSEDEVFADEFGIKMSRHDLNTLKGLNWLNDEVINFYLNLIVQRSERDSSLPKTYAFNTFFLKTLGDRGYAGVKRWTRKVDIFSYDILLIPVHLGNHWCLAVIDLKAREINYYDSLGGTNVGCLNTLKNYLKEEHLDKKKTDVDLSSWSCECQTDIPRQMNGSDCGVFTCCFAVLSSRRFEFKFDQRIMPYFRRRMVYEICQKQLLV